MANLLKPIRKKGVTLFEIVVVAAISSMVLTMAVVIMSRTTRSFKRGTDLLNIQRLMDNIVERIRTDVRSLKKMIPEECDEKSFAFMAIKDGGEKKIKYQYDDESKTLYRYEGTSRKSNFHGAKQVQSFVFKPEVDAFKKFRLLNVVMQLKSDEKGRGKASTLSIVCQFYSTCVEAELRISELRKKIEAAKKK